MSTVVMTTRQIEQELASIKRTLAELQSAIDRISAALHTMKTSQPAEQNSFKYTDLLGLGKEIWQNVDVDAYINAERDSWD
jgi:prefoldin subunit 5